jgi:hypothetical protein
MSHHKNGVCTFLSRFVVALCHTSEIFTKSGLPYFHRGRVVHQFLVTRNCFTRCWVNHGHRKMVQIGCSSFFLWSQSRGSVDGGRVVPNLVGKKINGLLTYYIVVTQSACDWDKTDLRDPLWEPRVVDALGSLAQPGRSPYWSCLGSGWGWMRGSARVIAGTVPGTLLRVMRRWTRFVVLSARFVVGFGAFMMGGASNIQQRSSNVMILGVGPTLCSLLGATLCWSCVGVLGWGTCWKSSSGRIHEWHGLVRKAGPPGCIVSSDNFS